MRGPKGFAVVRDIREWTDRNGYAAGLEIAYVERVRSALGIVQTLRQPPIARELRKGRVEGSCVPATQFPSWARCRNPECGALYHRPWEEEPESSLRCTRCESRSELEQVPWVLAHEAGYLSDVPWHFLAHRGVQHPSQQGCEVRNQLDLLDVGGGPRRLRCKACGAVRSYKGDERVGFKPGERMQPWTKGEFSPAFAAGPAQVLTVNDARVYSPLVKSALVIPPESRVRKGTVVDQLYRNSSYRESVDDARTPLARAAQVRRVARKCGCTPSEIEAALSDLAQGYPLYGASFTPGQLRESEFRAFLETLPDQRDDEDFVLQDRSSRWRSLCGKAESRVGIWRSIDRLVRVDRLKAINVFAGFKRLGGETIVPPDIIGQSDWLPAIQLHGEGIFASFAKAQLQIWGTNPAVMARVGRTRSRFVHSGRDGPDAISAEFMLLHTLSHLIMRQIEAEAGYPAASLAERIYCSQAPNWMAAILIYVAVPDEAGSLGGLSELAEPERFAQILTRAEEHARWCSLDPICSEHEGQGPGLLNRAACHACALVPEPACEYGNTLLDRGFVKGDDASGMPRFFDLPLG